MWQKKKKRKMEELVLCMYQMYILTSSSEIQVSLYSNNKYFQEEKDARGVMNIGHIDEAYSQASYQVRLLHPENNYRYKQTT